MNKLLRNRQNSGITLVALVVTVIILLVLAGISIQAITSTGLFGKAQQAKNKTQNSIEGENETLRKWENSIEQVASSRNDNQQIIAKSLINKNDGIYSVDDGGYVFDTPTSYITFDKNITLTDSIENYNYIIFEYDIFYVYNNSSPVKDYANPSTKIISSKIIKNMYTENFGWQYGKMILLVNQFGDIGSRVGFGFKNSNNIKVWNSWSATAQFAKLRITDIKGIK